jgi:glutathione synthase/RimK-type ligase-like ATP-grasp enzyme
VLPSGTSLPIKTATNYNGPEDSRTVAPPYPEQFVDLALRAAEALGVRLGGVDLVAGEEDLVVLEVNPTPGLSHHYNVADPERAPHIAAAILDALLAAGDRGGRPAG